MLKTHLENQPLTLTDNDSFYGPAPELHADEYSLARVERETSHQPPLDYYFQDLDPNTPYDNAADMLETGDMNVADTYIGYILDNKSGYLVNDYDRGRLLYLRAGAAFENNRYSSDPSLQRESLELAQKYTEQAITYFVACNTPEAFHYAADARETADKYYTNEMIDRFKAPMPRTDSFLPRYKNHAA